MAEERLHSNGWGSENVGCPFWRGETNRGICCEGMLDGETVRRLLPDKKAKQRQMRRFCAGRYSDCPWARFLNENKYK